MEAFENDRPGLAVERHQKLALRQFQQMRAVDDLALGRLQPRPSAGRLGLGGQEADEMVHDLASRFGR